MLNIFYEFKGVKNLTRGFIAAEFKDNASFDVLKARSEWLEYNNHYEGFAKASLPFKYRYPTASAKKVRAGLLYAFVNILSFVCAASRLRPRAQESDGGKSLTVPLEFY